MEERGPMVSKIRKIGKTTLFATLVATVVLAGTISARQLRTPAKSFGGACRGTCSMTVHCSGTCSCWIQSGTSGFCVQDLPGAKPQTK
jgi:hypothetical protein